MRIMPCLFVLLCAARLAVAGDDAGVVVTGDATVRPQLAADLEAWLRDHGHKPVDAVLPADAVKAIDDCVSRQQGNETCARTVVEKKAKAPAVVYASVEVATADDGTRKVTIVGYWFQKGADATATRRYCERCTEQSLREQADAMMSELAGSRQHGTGRLKLSSSPAGAKVMVDGNPVGVTPLDYDLAPGNHQVSVVLDRYQVETRPAAIRVGETTLLDVPLVATSETPADKVTPSGGDGGHVRKLPLALVIGGAAALGTGAVLIAIDEDPSPTGPLEIRNTAPLGVAVAVTGGVALAAGAWLYFHKSNSAPVASVSRDGGYVGWFARF